MTWSPRGHAKPQPTSSSPAAINMVPAPIATLRNLNIVQNGSILAILFSFWASGIAMFRSLFFEKKKQEPNFLTRDTLFEMKLTLSGAASSMLHELNFK